MGISYDPSSKKWNVVYEKTEYPLLSTDNTSTKTIYVNTESRQIGKAFFNRVITGVSLTPKTHWDPVVVDRNATRQSILSKTDAKGWELNYNTTVTPILTQLATDDTKLNQLHEQENAARTALKASNTIKNAAYDRTVSAANNTRGGDYVSQRDLIRNIEGLDTRTKETLENYYKAFYTTEKLQQWDPGLGAKPPYGEFNSSQYKTQSPEAAQQWASAVANDDIDITQRYGENGFYLQHYTTQGKPAGLRGNKAEVTAAANQYVEETPTDADLQAARTIQLGVDTATQTDRLLNIPTVASEW